MKTALLVLILGGQIGRAWDFLEHEEIEQNVLYLYYITGYSIPRVIQ